MRTRIVAAMAGVCAPGVLLLGVVGPAGAEGEQEPGMCMGRSDAGMVLNAHATGSPKFILNLGTDAAGHPDGVLILGRGSTRLRVDDLCRFWMHMPGQEPGAGHEGGDHGEGMEEVPEGATVAHAVGIGQLGDGTRVLVRADVRETEEGRSFRVRYRAMGQHGGEEGHDVALAEPGTEEGHDDEAWTRFPVEGWAALDMLKLRPAEG
jgi:hypothetical protein